MKKDLLVLGNGFDLSLGLKSSFQNYLDSKKSNINDTIDELNLSTPFLLFKRMWDIESIVDKNYTNIWEIICYLQDDDNDGNWSDVESNIYMTLDDLCLKNKNSGFPYYRNLITKLVNKFGKNTALH